MKGELLPKVAAGETLLSFAHTERQSRYDLADVAATAKKDGAGYVLDGAKSLALHGDCADKFIVSARVSGDQRDKNGIGLFLVDAKAHGRYAPRLSDRWTACAPPRSRWRASRSARTP